MQNVSFSTNTYPDFSILQNRFTNPIKVEKENSIVTKSVNNADCFVAGSENKSRMEKLNDLFPNHELEIFYSKMNNDFGIDTPAKLKFTDDSTSNVGGGYTFAKNEINMNLSDLIDSNTKIIGIKDGKETVLISEEEQLPLFVDKKSAEEFVKEQSKNGNLGYDRLITKPVTKEEQKKFILQKIAHEIVHAQQHMIMRNSDDIKTFQIMQAWDEYTPDNFAEKVFYNLKTFIDYKTSVWNKVDKNNRVNNNELNEEDEENAENWFVAIENYAPVDTKEYLDNELEKDANQRASEYIAEKFGNWN